MRELLYKNECYKIIGLCMEVHNVLGNGFLEAIYQEALAFEFKINKVPFIREAELKVFYKDFELGKFFIADFICFDEIIIEIKAVKELENIHQAQILNYLKVTKKKVGLLINFGADKLEYKRYVL